MFKRQWKLAALALAVAAALAAGAYRLRPTTADTPTLRLPAEVRGRPGRLVVVTAETTAAKVCWHACAGPDSPDLWQPADGKTLVFSTPTPGRYELWAWTAAGNEPTEAVGCTVVIETPEPPVRLLDADAIVDTCRIAADFDLPDEGFGTTGAYPGSGSR